MLVVETFKGAPVLQISEVSSSTSMPTDTVVIKYTELRQLISDLMTAWEVRHPGKKFRRSLSSQISPEIV